MAEFMEEGVVAALAFGKAKAGTREGWVKDLERVWDRSTGVLLKQKGFRGLRAMWAFDDSREVMIMGIWDTMEDRMNYERTVSKETQAAYNETMEAPARRMKYIVVKKTVN